jgi:hypothetical protein
MKKILLISLVIFIFSCENEETIDQPVFAGVINENMYFEDLSPYVKLNIIWDNCGQGEGYDSIDLFKDGRYDIFIHANFIDWHALNACCGGMDCEPIFIWYWIYSKRDIYFSSYDELWESENTLWNYADTLSEDYRIDTIVNWKYSTKLWCYDTPVSHGAWYNLSKDMYLGIRTGDSTNFKYGWILVGGNSNRNLIFKEYAIEK